MTDTNMLKAELEKTLEELNAILAARHDDYTALGYEGSIYSAIDTRGRPLLLDALAAKANCLAALTELSSCSESRPPENTTDERYLDDLKKGGPMALKSQTPYRLTEEVANALGESIGPFLWAKLLRDANHFKDREGVPFVQVSFDWRSVDILIVPHCLASGNPVLLEKYLSYSCVWATASKITN